MTPRGRRYHSPFTRFRPRITPLEDRSVPATIVALDAAGTSLLQFDSATPGTVTTTAVTGLAGADSLVGIDFRPQNNMLYGLGFNSGAGTVQLYGISPRTGTATVIGTTGTFVDAGGANVLISGPDFGFDFNPTVDRIRVVTSSGHNFRMDPNTGAFADGNLGGAAGSVGGLNMDGPINGGTTTVDAAAYTNNAPNVTVTTLYTLDAATDKLFIQNPPNPGGQSLPQSVTLAGTPLNFDAVGGFDIPTGINVTTSNAPVTTGSGFAALTVGGVTGFYSIDLVTGAATQVGSIGSGATGIRGLSTWNATAGYSSIGLGVGGTNLVRFNTATPGTSTTVAIGGVTAGETIVGIDWRPVNGQLFGLGINATANTGTIYRIDPQNAGATVIGTASSVAFVDLTGNATDFPDPATAGYGFDFNPTVDRIRVTTSTGLNFRLNPNNGAPVDTDANAANGINPDGGINGLPTGSTSVSSAAYTNSFAGTTITTLYTLDATSNALFLQVPPNAGGQAGQQNLTLSGAALDFSDVTGFDIPTSVVTAASNAAVTSGFGYATLTVGGVSNLYLVSLTTGVSGLIGAAPAALSGFALGDAPADMTPPGISSSTISKTTINGADVGGTVVVTYNFNELMDLNVIPTIATAPDASPTLVLSSSKWLDLDTHEFTFTIADADAEVTTFLTVSGGKDIAGNVMAPNTLVDSINIDTKGPTVTVEQAATQFDPTTTPPVSFTVTFSEAVTGFDAADVDLTASSAPGTLVATVTGTGADYTITVTGMLGRGAVVASIPAGAATDAATNTSTASTSTDNSVFFEVNIPPFINDVQDATALFGGFSGIIPVFAVDFETPVTNLILTATSSDQTVVADAGITLGGTGTNRTVVVAPNAGASGTATITLTVTDGVGATATDTFVVTIAAPPTPPTPPTGFAVTEAAGANPAAIQAAVDGFRTLIGGGTNAGANGSFGGVRREINWDGVPDTKQNPFPGDFFNTTSPRGVLLGNSDGSGFAVSGAAGTATFEFSDLTAQQWGPIEFSSFSSPKLFAPLGSTTYDVTFRVPGTSIPAGVRSFGTVFTDADLANVSKMEFFNANGTLLLSRDVLPTGVLHEGLSFLGVQLPAGQLAARVRVTTGSKPIDSPFQFPPPDGVAVDDFIYSEPVALTAVTVTDLFAVGTGPGISGQVNVFNANGLFRFALIPFPSFTGGVRVATGDVSGDGFDDIAAAAGPGGGPHVKVFDGVTGAEIRSFFAYDSSFTGGAFVGLGDLTGDLRAEVVTGAGAGGGPHVKAFDGVSNAEIRSFFAYAADFTGGVNVRAGDVDADGFADIVTGTGPGGGPHVKSFSGKTNAELQSFFSGDPNSRDGVFVGAADLVGTRNVEVIHSSSGTIKAFGYIEQDNVITNISNGSKAPSVPVAAVRFTGGANPVNAILIGSAPGTDSKVSIVDGTSNTVLASFFAFPGFLGGAFVG